MNKPFIFAHNNKSVLDAVEYSILGRYGHVVNIAKSATAIVVLLDLPVADGKEQRDNAPKSSVLRKDLDTLTKGILDAFRYIEESSLQKAA